MVMGSGISVHSIRIIGVGGSFSMVMEVAVLVDRLFGLGLV